MTQSINELKSYTEYNVSAPTSVFTIGFQYEYNVDHVNVYVDGVEATAAGYTIQHDSQGTVQLTPAVPSGVVRLSRETAIDTSEHTFSAGAKFTAGNMDENFEQIRHSQQEVRDGFSKLSTDTYEIIDTLQDVGQAAQDAADAAEQAAQAANDAAAQVNDKVSYQDLDDAVELAVTPVRDYIALPFEVDKVYDLNTRVQLSNGDIVKSTIDGNTNNPNVNMTGWTNPSLEQKKYNDRWVDITNLLISGDTTEAKAWNKIVFDTAAAKAKADSKGIYCAPRPEISLGAAIDLFGITDIYLAVDIKNPINTLFIGGLSNTGKSFNVYLQTIHNGTSTLTGAIPSIPTIMLSGVKGGSIIIGSTNLLNIHAIGGSTSCGSNAYFDIFVGGVVRSCRVTDEGSGGWNNKFTVTGGRIINIDIIGTGYKHNEIEFRANTLEGTNVKIYMDNCYSNRITDARFEGANASQGIEFTSSTYANTIVQRWTGTGSNRSQFIPYPPVIDNGRGNNVTSCGLIEFDKVELFNVGVQSLIVANGTDSASPDRALNRQVPLSPNRQIFKPRLNGVEYIYGNRPVAASEMVAVQHGDVINFDCDYDGALLRPIIYIYDANRQLITTGTNHILMIGGNFNSAQGFYSVVANQTANAINQGFEIYSQTVKYIEVALYGTASGTFRNLACNLYTQKFARSRSMGLAKQFEYLPTLNGAPTSGYAQLDQKIINSATNKMMRCSYSLRTRTTVAATASTSITLNSSVGILAGDIVGVLQSDGSTLWTTVSSSSGGTLTLPVAVTVAAGALVVIVRWVEITFV